MTGAGRRPAARTALSRARNACSGAGAASRGFGPARYLYPSPLALINADVRDGAGKLAVYAEHLPIGVQLVGHVRAARSVDRRVPRGSRVEVDKPEVQFVILGPPFPDPRVEEHAGRELPVGPQFQPGAVLILPD